MSTDAIEAAGIKPIEPELERITAVLNLAQLQDEAAHLQSLGTHVFFSFGSEQDDKNSQQVIGGALQGGLGLPDRDYYTKDDDKSKQIRDQYVQHIAKMMELAGDAPDKVSAEARTVLAIETQMAKASKTRVERRDPEANYHKMDPAQLRRPDMPDEAYRDFVAMFDFFKSGRYVADTRRQAEVFGSVPTAEDAMRRRLLTPAHS